MKLLRDSAIIAVILVVFFSLGTEIRAQLPFGGTGWGGDAWAFVFSEDGEGIEACDTAEQAGVRTLSTALDSGVNRWEWTMGVSETMSLSANNGMSVTLMTNGSESISVTLTGKKGVKYILLTSKTSGRTTGVDSVAVELTRVAAQKRNEATIVARMARQGASLCTVELNLGGETILRRRNLQIPEGDVTCELVFRYTKKYSCGSLSMSQMSMSEADNSDLTEGTAERCPLIVTEIMATASPSGGDYVEVLNIGEGTEAMADYTIAYTNGSGTTRRVRLPDKTIASGEYVALTRDAEALEAALPRAEKGRTEEMSLPVLAAEGVISIDGVDGWNEDETIAYGEAMQNAMMADSRNVSLERISNDRPGNDLSNWASASTESGGGTPGLENSQSAERSETGGWAIRDGDKVFAPECEQGVYPTKASVVAETGGGNVVASMRIYSPNGNLIAEPRQNEPTGAEETIWWDGRDSAGRIVPPGTYIVLTELTAMDGSGRRMRHKSTCTVTICK